MTSTNGKQQDHHLMLSKHKPTEFIDGEDIYSAFIQHHTYEHTHTGHMWLKSKVSVLWESPAVTLAGTIILNNVIFFHSQYLSSKQ